jgi:hemerythrin superfamily protein
VDNGKTKATTGSDVEALIRADHRVVASLMKELAAGQGDTAEIRGRIVKELSMHSAAEEQVVYPMLLNGDADGQDGELANRHARDEHADIKRALLDLDRCDPNDADFMATLGRLRGAVEHHVADEESTVLPLLRRIIGDQEMAKLGDRFETAKKTAPTRPHPHAPDSPPGNMVAGTAAAVADRARDAMDRDRP